jgi:hypothetical protein
MAANSIRTAWSAYRQRLIARSEAIPRALGQLTVALTIGWAGVFLAFASFRIIASPRFANDPGDWLGLLFPYAAIALGPLAGLMLGEACFPQDARLSPPGVRLSAWGRWRKLAIQEVRAHPLFGPAGFMASLLIGLLLNVLLRSFEFLIAMPALSAQAPSWGRELFLLMAVDVGVMAFFYMVAFAFALHSVTLFPRMLAFCWMLDILMQLLIARHIGALPELPADVALALRDLLWGNVAKVLISAFVWLPYLLLSERVNITYRHRMFSGPRGIPKDSVDEAADTNPDQVHQDHPDQSV